MKKNLNAHRRVLDYACEDTKALFDQFQLSGQGYTEAQAEESRDRYGRNVVAGRAADTVLYRLRRAFINPFTVILFILASISFLTDVVLASNFSRNITTVVIILCMLLISGLVRFVQELRAKHVADHLTGMVATSVLVRRDGRWQNLSSAELAVGEDTVYGGFTVTSVCRKNGFDQGANSIAWALIRFMAVLIPVAFIVCGLTKGNWGSAFCLRSPWRSALRRKCSPW